MESSQMEPIHLGLVLNTHYCITLGNERGVIEKHEFDNILTDAFLSRVLARVSGSSTNAIGYMAIGTGTGTVAASDTALFTESTRKAITWTVSGSSMTGTAFYGNTEANGTLTECGMIDLVSSGTLMSHALFTNPVIKTSSRWLQIDVTVTAARG